MASLSRWKAGQIANSIQDGQNRRWKAGQIANSIQDVIEAIDRMESLIANDLDMRPKDPRSDVAVASYIGQGIACFRDGLDSLATAKRMMRS